MGCVDGGNDGFFWRFMRRIPDPVVIFICLYAVAFVLTIALSGTAFSMPGAEGRTLAVKSMATPEVVTAAYRSAEPCTNIITPVMNFAGVILVFCRKWNRDFTIGEQIMMMLPYSAAFFVVSAVHLLVWYKSGLPFGF